MLKKLNNHILNNFPFLKEKKLLLAFSGGIDSMVLVDLFSKLNFEVSIAHCNFQLRGDESKQDEEFVKTQSEKYKIISFIKSFETTAYANANKLSIQQAARELRYNWFNDLLEKEGFDYLLTAHHLDDSLETFLINFTRGTGIDGLTGIPEQNGRILRPLLIFSREEIENYASENNISWREDSSNASDKYFRNKIRHHIVPVLKELNPSLLTSFENTIENLQQTQTLANDSIETMWKQISKTEKQNILLNIKKILALPNYKSYLFEWLKPYGFLDWNTIYELINSQSGKQVFSSNFRLIKDREYLILAKIETAQLDEFIVEENQKDINFPIKLLFSDENHIQQPSKSSIFVDKVKLKFPLKLRKWQEGDYFYPSGMQGKKKVSKYFKDEKFSLLEKEDTWLLCSDNEVVWIINHRADQRFLANNNTQQILKIELQ